MKTFVKEFCQGIYDSMMDKPLFLEKYTLDSLFEVFYPALISVLVKIFTLFLGIVACWMASNLLGMQFSMLFWVWITCCIVWVSGDDLLKQAFLVLKDISNMK